MMNIEPGEFEMRLSRQSLRQVPPTWREEILAVAGRASSVERREQRRFKPSSLVSRLSSVFWPHPVAWAGLATAWVFIIAVDFSTGDRTPVLAESSSPPPEVIIQVRQQQRLLAEMLGPRDARDADRSKPSTAQPRSERSFEISTA